LKLVVLYAQPDDPAAFDAHYVSAHVPMMHKLGGVERFETGTFTAALDGGEPTYHRLTELYFRDQAAMDAAFASPVGAAMAEDYAKIAPPGSRMFIAAVDD